MIEFEFEEDRKFFENLILGSKDDSLEDYSMLFDFRHKEIKRREFNKIRNQVFKELIAQDGLECQLHFDCCDENSGYAVDHLIPLTTNKLNKEIRKLPPELKKKVVSQYFGSNQIYNLVIACNNCNNFKKHKFPTKDLIQKILKNRIK